MRRTSCTVLVVDDAPEDRALYRRYLERSEECRYAVLEVDRGEHALAAVRERRPDCVLLDYLMPGKDGLAVLHELTREAAGAAAVIMLTGSARDPVGVQALKAGALDYLDKNTMTAEQLHRSIQYALKKVDLQRAVERQRQWLQGTLDSIGEAVIATDGEGRVVFMNPVAEAMLGVRIRSVQGRPIEEICTILDEHTHRALGSSFIELALKREVNAENHALLVSGGVGRERPVEYRLSPIRNEKGEVQGAVVALRDISARRRIEASLKEREERLALVTRVASDAMWDWDLRADHVWWNEAYEALFGRPPQRTGHAPQWRLERVHPEDRPRVAREMHVALNGAAVKWVLDYRGRTLDGDYRRFVERAVIVRDGEARPVRILALMLDVSDWPAAGTPPGAVQERGVS